MRKGKAVLDFLDSSILVAAHDPDDDSQSASLDLFLRDGWSTAAHCLAEVYATLTGKLQAAPADAARIVEAIGIRGKIVTMTGADITSVIKSAPKRGIRGALIYDALIARAATISGARRIWTLNVDHFQIVTEGASVLRPGRASRAR